jgi:hypothetical protein
MYPVVLDDLCSIVTDKQQVRLSNSKGFRLNDDIHRRVQDLADTPFCHETIYRPESAPRGPLVVDVRVGRHSDLAIHDVKARQRVRLVEIFLVG